MLQKVYCLVAIVTTNLEAKKMLRHVVAHANGNLPRLTFIQTVAPNELNNVRNKNIRFTNHVGHFKKIRY